MNAPASVQQSHDPFGNEIDSSVGYARGRVLRSSKEEVLRLDHCRRIATQRVMNQGIDSIGIFTGHRRISSLSVSDVNSLCDEWVGTFLIESQFKLAAINHLGGSVDDDVFLFNRTSAGIICAISILSKSSSVLSIVPRDGRSHASVQRGCLNARVRFVEVAIDQNWKSLLRKVAPELVIVTAVTSKLEALSDLEINEISEFVHALGGIVLLDDAYGARIRPALYGGSPSLSLDVDLAVTNCDKAGLHGPRAGLVGGRRDLIAQMSTAALEWGMEGRAPARIATLRALERYSHQELSNEAALGATLTAELRKKFPTDLVISTALGPLFSEDALLHHMRRRRPTQLSEFSAVPCEVTAALGVLLLKDHGILTINTHGQPGASVTLRLKPNREGLENVGGIVAVGDALDLAIRKVSENLDDEQFFSQLILGI